MNNNDSNDSNDGNRCLHTIVALDTDVGVGALARIEGKQAMN